MGEILGGQHPRPLSLALLGSSPKGRGVTVGDGEGEAANVTVITKKAVHPLFQRMHGFGGLCVYFTVW